MSNEQSKISQYDQPNWYGQESAISSEQSNVRKSNLESVAIFQARQAIAAAISTAPSGTLETKTPEMTMQPETPSQEMRKIARMLNYMRSAYSTNTFNLEDDDELSMEVFDTPKPDTSDMTQDDVGLAA